MLEKMKSAWRIPELRKKIIYTFGMLLVYRLLCVIPVPGINVSAVASAVKDYSILDFMNMMTGGSFQNMSIMAMGITPYINSSIILQLLTVAIPALEKLDCSAEYRDRVADIRKDGQRFCFPAFPDNRSGGETT